MKVVILYAKLAPFHVARLERAGLAGQGGGRHLVGMEVADMQSDYRWAPTPQPGKHYSRVTLFRGLDYWALPYRIVRRSLYRALDAARPDVAVLPGWGFREALAGLSWCIRRGVPRVVISDSQSIDRPQKTGKLWVKRLLVQRFQAAFVAGRPHARYVASLGMPEERCFVGCDVVDNDFFTGGARQQRGSDDGQTADGCLLSCLRLLPRKNILGMLDVLANRAKQWTWMIAGDGPQRSEIEKAIRALGLTERVHLLGHVDYTRLPALYARASAYLQPSLSEPWGLAVNEAMASGLPVVVSERCGSHEDLVRAGVNGFTFDPASSESAAEALDRLWTSRSRWSSMGRESQAIISRWGLDLFARNLWQACAAALHPLPERSGTRAITKALGRLL